jgi:methylmalonyl-CoA/ethylmalonyl-CoA epimerase
MIDAVPRAGAHGCRVAFIHPSEMGGVLVELSQSGAH